MYQTAINLITSELNEVDKKILEILLGNKNFLTENFIQFILNGSKKIRSAIVVLSLKSLGCNVSTAQITVCALGEIIHNASLIHDDIVDKADKRRGISSFNNTFGNSAAVLAGDFLISLVLQEILKLNNNNILSNFVDMFSNLCNGEINQLGEKNQIISVSKYLEKSEKKTAELFKTILISAFEVDNLRQYYDFALNFGKNFGIAFQIRDDILNCLQKSDDKPVLSDFDNGICTLPMIFYAEEKNLKNFCEIKIKDIQNSCAINKSADICRKFANNALDLTKDFSDNQYTDALRILCEELKRI